MNYTHLTHYERYQIYILKTVGHNPSTLATLMNRDKSTISRELTRNRGQRGYWPKQAHQFSVARMRATENGRRIDPATWAFAQAKLAERWSPEQIAAFLKIECEPTVSHETLYQRIYADKRAGGSLWRHLRWQKLRRKRYGHFDRRGGTIAGWVSIERRPAVVEARSRIGDWEGDTIIGANHRQAIVSLVERKSCYTLPAKNRAQNRRRSQPGDDPSAQTFQGSRPYLDDGQWQGVRRTSCHRPPGRCRHLFRPSRRFLGARRQREYQRSGASVLPQEAPIRYYRTTGDQPRHAKTQSPTSKMPRLQNSSPGVYAVPPSCCTSRLNPPA